jgi:hypothetical protein
VGAALYGASMFCPHQAQVSGIVNERRCIITDEPITSENNSKAHVIPSALGGRLRPSNILCKDGNGLLGETVDLPLIQAFQSLMTLLNGSRDRRENQSVRMMDASGRTYVMKFGEPLELANFDYREVLTEDGVAFDIRARNLRELRTILGRVKAKHSDFDIDEAMKHAVEERTWPDGLLHGQLQIGPRVVFPALFVSASIFAAHHDHPAHPGLRDYVARFDPDQPELPPDTFFFMPPQPWISAPGEVTHIVALLGSAERKEMLVYFELLNAVHVAVLLPYDAAEDARATYAVDILTGANVLASIHEEGIKNITWQATHKLGDEQLYRLTRDRIGRLIGLSLDRARKVELEALSTRAFGDPEVGALTAQDVINAIGEFAKFVLAQWQHPLSTVSLMEQNLQIFETLCSALAENFVASCDQPAFRAAVGDCHKRLVGAIWAKRRNGVN